MRKNDVTYLLPKLKANFQINSTFHPKYDTSYLKTALNTEYKTTLDGFYIHY